MKKGEFTRQMIIQRAAAVFNQRGYFGTSIADLVAETGLERGGIYNHFDNKDDLALAAFDYAVKTLGERLQAGFDRHRHTADQLIAIGDVFLALLHDPDLPGGCPVLNTAIVADDTHPELKARAQQALANLRGMVEAVVIDGITRGEIKPETDPSLTATHLIALVEGGMMMSKLCDDPRYSNQIVILLTRHVNCELRRQ
ncbi:MAG: TetR/AcrR family transcriptional regulator [Chloroflexota bacterium]